MTDAAPLAGLRRQIGGVLKSPKAVYASLAGFAGVIVVLALSSLASLIVDGWIQRDLDLRSTLIFRSLADKAAQPGAGELQAFKQQMQKAADEERIFGLAFCTRDGALALATAAMPPALDCAEFSGSNANEGVTLKIDNAKLRFNRFALTLGGTPGQLLVAQNIDEARSGQRDALTYATAALAAAAFGFGFLAVVVTAALRRSWMSSLRGAIAESIRTTEPPVTTGPADRRINALLGDLRVRRKFVHGIYVRWSPESLRQLLLDQLPDAQVMIVSNREPYIHNRENGEIKLQIPASGLVSALEPVMRACRGVWIAHGGGSADRETVDKNSRLMVPPADPTYALRRVWLSEEEQDGYYYGLANEGLWPLCHIAFIRPTFREQDWAMYRAVNQRFADVVVEEATCENPIVLVQDYHFALLPRMIRKALPKATVVTFWHIPWPNAETFSICPWREEILDGLLGSSILGFHTQFHCNNFFDSVDRFIESRIDHENSLVSFGGRETLVRPYPISIEWPPRGLLNQPSVEQCRINVRERFGLAPDTRIAVGVERFDYTKGILDRMRAVDDLLTMAPQWRGKFVLIQVAAPTRSKLDAYAALEAEARNLADEINAKYARDNWSPILLVVRHHEPTEVFELFRAADACVVSSLHDGMNLVAKEFIAARDDERGVLILSSFAGAAYELPEALIVNPYDTHQMAKAYDRALTMSEEEQAGRMQIMVAQISERNVYRWAAQMLFDASWLRRREKIVPSDNL
ncbi:trehalose 6-phosphate synthase [Rhodoblastus acidophilus]|uniref:Trehalose 6-phosphate synthase n=1 Tax=Rhodoblastus acidophilus TaxID=1074 RepID=A0A212RES4_RHOAC|nr:trehalose-6-phosphate synthase [Rhodoblastus acidophilus]MCW2316812.1 trehalose 6-phosphate synthase [Rhodoblastus acidophilus]PPQ39703.1 trehalose-6-phosphate synthase [Rhodoblastus acidophilus]RAI24485.1 trehalose-6-phosphate synthase [Rhodoblastus acidophilus]SNB70856.1 trehalose 6-phosphate synthase [Rhodoblastus acidophilus]